MQGLSILGLVVLVGAVVQWTRRTPRRRLHRKRNS